jgi:dipeptidyl aminopeptidase/acylaminoacyl peptidase
MRLVTAADLYRMRYVSDPQLAPDGQDLAYVLTTVDREGDGYRSAIHRMPTAGGVSQEVAAGTYPRWRPDGQVLAYLFAQQVWTHSADSEERQVTDLPAGVSSYAWSPDGSWLAVTANVPLGAAPLASTAGLHHITRLKYKSDGLGYIYESRPQLFVVEVATGEARQITDSPFGAESLAWAPDGRHIGFITAPADPDGTWERQIVTVPSDGGPLEVICTAVGAQDLSWSPDGGQVAFRAACQPYDPSVSFGLWVAPVSGGTPVQVTAGFDRFVGNDRTMSDTLWGKVPQGGAWSADGRELYFVAADHGENTVCAVSAAGGPVRRLNRAEPAMVVANFSYCPTTGTFVAAAATPLLPGDLWRLPAGERLTHVNDDWLTAVDLAQPERLGWTGGDGAPCEGWVLKPPGFDPARTYPAILYIHGGPYRQHGMTFFHELQLLAAGGYVVFYPNPRGSQGYGQEFAHGIHGDWGRLDYADLMAGVDRLLAEGYVDVDRLGVTGGSYGGYLTNWIVTQTNRFKAAVTDRSLSNLYSFAGTADVAFSFAEPIFGSVWEPDQVARMLDRSPITHVRNVQTPVLILHQMEDHCCALEQAEQFYMALKRLGRTVEMVLFPGASHELSRSGKPSQRLQRLQWTEAWFDKYL